MSRKKGRFIKQYRHLVIFSAGFFATIAAIFYFVNSSTFFTFETWVSGHMVAYAFLLFLVKTVGIIWPPLPGGLLTLASIPILGTLFAYVLDLAGNVAGSTIAYFLAKRFGYSLLRKIFDEKIIDQLKRIKVSRLREIEAVFMFRFFGSTIVEVACYGAGLFGIRFRNYLIGSVASHMVIGIPKYYLIGNIFADESFVLSLILLIGGAILLYRLRHRYLETAVTS